MSLKIGNLPAVCRGLAAAAILGAGAIGLGATPASAATPIVLSNTMVVNGQTKAVTSYVFQLTQAEGLNGTSGFKNLPSSSFGKVTVLKNNDGTLGFNVKLASGVTDGKAWGFSFHQTTTSTHEAFAFSIAGDPTLQMTGLAKQFTPYSLASGDKFTAPPFATTKNGYFQTGVSCVNVKKDPTSCPTSYNTGLTSLSFTIKAPNKNLNFSDLQGFLYGLQTVFFAADVAYRDINGNVYTGNIANGSSLNMIKGYVPEPDTWVTMIIGFGVLGSVMRRRNAEARRAGAAGLA